jgi:hypothetical protein
MDWAYDQGVSIDWLIRGDEASLITYRAAHAAPPRNVADPIFAAIENYKRHCEVYMPLCHQRDEAWVKAGKPYPANHDPALQAKIEALMGEESEAREALELTVPTTLNGLLAVLDLVVAEHDRRGATLFDDDRDFLESVAESVRNLAVQS